MRISDWSSDVALPICQQSHQRSRLGLSPLSAAHFRGRSGGETMSVHAPGTRWYNAVWRWHFYAGLFCIPFVIWLALTGTIYTWGPQIEAWLDRAYAPEIGRTAWRDRGGLYG